MKNKDYIEYHVFTNYIDEWFRVKSEAITFYKELKKEGKKVFISSLTKRKK